MKLEICQITKSYGKKRALNEFHYSFENGVYALLGPNGAGKSTLFHILTLNLKPDSGRILFEGKDAFAHKREYLSQIGYIPQQQELYAGFTLERFLWYMAALKGLSKVETEREIAKVAQWVHLTDELGRKLGAFSGGMKQRAMIAQAFLGNPKLIICDEPTAGLDPKERVQFRKMIAEYSKNSIIIIATHIVPDVENIARKVIFLKKGHIALAGNPQTISEQIGVHSGMMSELETCYMEIFEKEAVDENARRDASCGI